MWPWKSNKYYTFWVCVCSLSYPACNEHVPYFHLSPVRLYHIFTYYLTNGKIFRKKNVTEHKMCFDFLYLFSKTFFILRRIRRNITINVCRSSCKIRVIRVMFNETYIFWTDFDVPTSIVSFIWAPSTRGGVAYGVRTLSTNRNSY
jgi:hypothetical protein